MRRTLAVLLVIAAAGAVWAVFIREVDDDPYDCGPVELAVPEVVDAAGPPPAVVLDPVLVGEDVVDAEERDDGRLLAFTRDARLLQVDPATGDAEEVLAFDAHVL